MERLEAKQTVYPGYVERALVAIRSQFPKADPRVLCDYIEVTDPRWQSWRSKVISGGARFNIIVDGEYEADAIRLVRPFPDATTACASFKVRRRAYAARIEPVANSIVHVLNTTPSRRHSWSQVTEPWNASNGGGATANCTRRNSGRQGLGQLLHVPLRYFRCGSRLRSRSPRTRAARSKGRTARSSCAHAAKPTSGCKKPRLLETVDKLQPTTYMPTQSAASCLYIAKSILPSRCWRSSM